MFPQKKWLRWAVLENGFDFLRPISIQKYDQKSMSSDRSENRCAGVFFDADHAGNVSFSPKCPLVCSHGNVFLPVTTPCSRLGESFYKHFLSVSDPPKIELIDIERG